MTLPAVLVQVAFGFCITQRVEVGGREPVLMGAGKDERPVPRERLQRAVEVAGLGDVRVGIRRSVGGAYGNGARIVSAT